MKSIFNRLVVVANRLDQLGEIHLADELTRVVLKLAAPADMTAAEEKYWDEAEKIAKDEYSPTKQPDKFYGTVTNIFKAKVKKHLKHDPFKKKKKKKKK
jgi:hypothetical protein